MICSSPPTSSIRKKLAAAGLVDNASLRTYAIGHLVLWVPNSSKLDPQKLKMDLLLRALGADASPSPIRNMRPMAGLRWRRWSISD